MPGPPDDRRRAHSPARCPRPGLAGLTWWIEGIRHALFPGGISAVGGPGSLFSELGGAGAPDSALIVLVLLATGTVATLGALAVFRVSDRRAKDRGLFDQTTGS